MSVHMLIVTSASYLPSFRIRASSRQSVSPLVTTDELDVPE